MPILNFLNKVIENVGSNLRVYLPALILGVTGGYIWREFVIRHALGLDFTLNFVTELFGLFLTVFLIDELARIRETRRRDPFRKSLMNQIITKYYLLVFELYIIWTTMPVVNNTGKSVYINYRIKLMESIMNDLDNIIVQGQDTLSFDERNNMIRINGMLNSEIEVLKMYEVSEVEGAGIMRFQIIIDIMEIAKINNEIIQFIDTYPVTKETFGEFGELLLPQLSWDEIDEFLPETERK